MTLPGLPVAESRRGDEDRSLSWSDMTIAAQIKFEVSCQKGSTGARQRLERRCASCSARFSSRADACEMKMGERMILVAATTADRS